MHPIRPLAAAALACALLALPARAQHVPVDQPALRGDISGSWYDPAQPGHGLMLEVLPGGRAVVTWYTFDPQGAPMWLSGSGEVDGPVLRASLVRVDGGAFPPAFDPEAIQRSPWGTVEVEFAGCNEGELRWQPTAAGFSAGSMPLERLTAVDGTQCNAAERYGEARVFSFERGMLGFDALFADLPPGEDAFYELDFAWEPLPEPLDARRGLRLSGNNHSDDLAMLVTAPLRGLLPDTLYDLRLELEMASNVPTGCVGVGGSPGDSVYIKLGASTVQPVATVDNGPQGNGWLRLNVDVGQQAQSGANARVVGTLANGFDCDDGTDAPWQLKVLDTTGQVLRVRTDGDGTLWVIAGSDSAFEGRTDWYLTRLTVLLDAVAEGG